MDPSPEEFDSLRRLLALKRHETPPPGYFRDFSSRVTARIEREERQAPESLWSRLRESFGWRPALLGANAVIVAGLGLVVLSGVFRTSRDGVAHGNGGGRFAPASAGMDLAPFVPTGAIAAQRPILTDGLQYQIHIVPVEPVAPSNRLPASILSPNPPAMPASWNEGR